MSARLPRICAALLVPGLVLLIGCTRSDAPATTADAPAAPATRTPASGTVVTISAAKDVILAELPIGSAQGLEPGAFLRVYAAGDGHVLKGMLQVTEVLGPQRAVARQITLADRQNPFIPGDVVREVLDLAGLADPKAIEQAARTATVAADQRDSVDQARHAVLREQYQKELTAAKARFDHDLGEIRRQYEAQLSAADAVHALDVQRREQELRADLAALKTTYAEQVAAGIAVQRQASDARIAKLESEKDNLSKQVQGLLTRSEEQSTRITELVTKLADKDREHAANLRAEVETREQLAANISELESRLAGKPTSSLAVLSAEPGQGETVLARLTRLTNELASEREKAKVLEATLATTRGALTRAGEANTTLTKQLEHLGGSDTKASDLAKQLASTSEKLATAEQQRAELELARLEAERQLFDLAARVLRLAGSSPETMALQARLRDVLGHDAEPKQ
jgi:DNA repair exonuclease SbcCD ATPase subunit